MELDIDNLINHAKAYGEGLKQGKEIAIKNYDKLFLEIFKKLEDLEYKFDAFTNAFQKFYKHAKSTSSEMKGK